MSTKTETLRRMLGEASLDWDETRSGPGEMLAEALGNGGALLWHDDGDCAATLHPHPLIDPMALASLVAAVLPALPALLDVVEAAKELRRIQDVDHTPTAMDWERLEAAEKKLDAALAALEEA